MTELAAQAAGTNRFNETAFRITLQAIASGWGQENRTRSR